MSFLHFLLVVVSLGSGTLPPSETVDLATSMLASAGLLVGWALLCHIAAFQLAKSVELGQINPIDAANYLNVQLQIFRYLGLGVVAMCLAGFGLAPAIGAAPVLKHWMSIQAVALLIPASALVAMTASAEFTFMRRLDESTSQSAGGGRLAYVMAQCRGGLAWLAIPVVVLMGIADAIGMLPLPPVVVTWTLPIAAVTMVLAGLPLLTRWIFRSSPMPPARQAWYQALLRRSGAGKISVSRWDTGATTSNAMVAGFVPPWRRLWITDRIEDELPAAQVAMIVLHEAGHLRRRHMPLRMLALLPAWGVGLIATRWLGDWQFAEAGGLVAGLMATLVSLRLASHATEYDADAWACRAAEKLGGEIEHVPRTYDEAAETLSSALRRVTIGTDTRKSTWLHPSVDRRAERLVNQRQVLLVATT